MVEHGEYSHASADAGAAAPRGERRQQRVLADTGDGSDWLVSADSDQQPVLSFVLPTLNEEEGIETCLRRIKAAVADLELPTEIIVSDSSTDSTPEIAAEQGAIVVYPDEEGYGYAYQYGFEHARGEYVVIGDADTTYDFTELPKLLGPVMDGDADICMGSRLAGEIKPGAMPPLHRYVGNPLLTRFLNVFYDAGVSDAHSGFRVISREALEQMDLGSTGMEFASEMVMEAAVQGLTIEEKPIVYHEREGEETLDSFRDGWRHVEFMLVNAPGYLFSIPGLLLGLFGTLVMAGALLGVEFGDVSLGPRTMIAGSLFTIVGYQVTTLGVFATIAGDPIRAPTDPVTKALIDKVTFETAATIGLALFLVGGSYAASLVVRVVADQFRQPRFLLPDIVAFTMIVMGVQTVFGAFFLSAIAKGSSD